ncbi:MAG TPA: GNAT family N-acetyltransferase [Solirubrobacteraceae bacterium]|jgi:ribosomal protein S18 acetylase RimI-like enzyme
MSRDASKALHFEQIGPEHIEELTTLFERNRMSAVTEMFDPFPLDAAQARKIALHGGEDAFYLARSDKLAVGFSMLRGFDEGYAIPSFGIFVDRESQGWGVGRKLTAWTIEQARAGGCPAVRLTVYAANVAACRLYESLGFVELERQSVERLGRREEKIVMRVDFGGRDE